MINNPYRNGSTAYSMFENLVETFVSRPIFQLVEIYRRAVSEAQNSMRNTDQIMRQFKNEAQIIKQIIIRKMMV
jgi:hypothetical protein